MRMPEIRRLGAAVVVSLFAALSLAACGSDKTSNATSSSSNSSGANAGASSAVAPGVANAKALLAKVKTGTSVAPATTSRPAAKGKHIVIVVNGLNQPSSAFSVDGITAACTAIGWQCSTLDGKSDPTQWPGLIRTAVAQKPDGIIVYGIDCPIIAGPLAQAKAANIPTVGTEAFDCTEPGLGGKKLFSATQVYPDPMDPSKTMSFRVYAQKFGATKAAAVIAATNGKPNVIMVCDDEALILKYICDGQTAAFKNVPDAKVTRVDTRLADLGPKLESEVSSALLKTPDANAIISPHGGASLFIASAVQKAGKTGKIFVMGSEGPPAELAQVKAGGVNAIIGADTRWTGWSAVDTMNSVLTNKPVVNNGLGWLYIDKQNVPADPSNGIPANKFPDYKSAYKQAWGVK